MDTLFVVINEHSYDNLYFFEKHYALDYVIKYILNNNICTRSKYGYSIAIEVYVLNAQNPMKLSYILVPQNIENFMKDHNFTKQQVLDVPSLCYDIFGSFTSDIFGSLS
jgi:intein-encoded DNA endonuclease-like protein